MAEKNIAIVLAAGQGKRMQSNVHKQYLLLAEKPVLYYSLKAMEESFIDEIVLVTGKGEEEYCRKEIVDKYGFLKVKEIVPGGKERYHSVIQGLKAAGTCDYIYIHDGARPFVDAQMLERARVCVRENNACVVAMPVKDTIKIADENGFAKETPRRDLVWTVQTPQVFAYELIKDAYDQLEQKEQQVKDAGVLITDDAMVVEYFKGTPVMFAEGSYYNIKITTPEDLKIAEAFLQ